MRSAGHVDCLYDSKTIFFAWLVEPGLKVRTTRFHGGSIAGRQQAFVAHLARQNAPDSLPADAVDSLARIIREGAESGVWGGEVAPKVIVAG
jgi:hypothetical protein